MNVRVNLPFVLIRSSITFFINLYFHLNLGGIFLVGLSFYKVRLCILYVYSIGIAGEYSVVACVSFPLINRSIRVDYMGLIDMSNLSNWGNIFYNSLLIYYSNRFRVRNRFRLWFRIFKSKFKCRSINDIRSRLNCSSRITRKE